MVLGERTAELVKDHYSLVELDCIAVKGKTKGIKIFTIVNANGIDRSYLKSHESFIKAYRSQDWNLANNYIKNLNGAFKGELDEYYSMMKERIVELSASKLPKDWDGVYRATSK
jgi:hypothetical protein